MHAEEWGCLSGNIFYKTGLFGRGKAVGSCQQGATRTELRPIIRFKPKQTSRWNFQFSAQSLVGDFSFEIRAINPPLIGYPRYEGVVRKQSQIIAEIASENEPCRILSIRAVSFLVHVTAERLRPGYRESDIVFQDASVGEIAKISRRGEDETLREQLESKLGFGLCKRGYFIGLSRVESLREPMVHCTLAAICLYLYLLEPLLNTEYPSG